ncbi:unnamed protein product [Adineta steineri]|uniref:Uncharacterized protein n=1 Tax=Adineta steineri TaxID=433720 RepID=A0A819FZE6_9BILA|nr:unnamed protein product [Adineta steineri]
MSASSSTTNLTEEVLSFCNEEFYNLVKKQCGDIVLDIMIAQDISSVECLLEIDNIFNFLKLNSDDLIQLKKKAGIYLNDGRYMIKEGIIYKVETFLRTLRILNQQRLTTDHHHKSDFFPDVLIPNDVLQKFPFIRTIITYSKFISTSKTDFTFLNIMLNNMFNNLISDERGYRYDNIIRQFAASIYILGGRSTYNFLRLNIPALLPSVQIIQSYIAASESNLTEGLFNYNRICNYFNSNQVTLGFCAEHCTAIIPKITYNTSSNSFVGFSRPIDVCGIPVAESFSTESFTRFEHIYSTLPHAKSLNAIVIQPLSSSLNNTSPYLLAAYGTDGKFTAAEIISRWLHTHQEFKSKGVRIVGYSSDCDSRYLLAMKSALGFFAHFAFPDHPDLFTIDLPMSWSWFFMQHEILFVCMQDATHICTKLRNRLLSTTATLLFGSQLVNIDPLLHIINNFSKFDHGLVRSDINPKDRQNFNSAAKISSDAVLNLLEQVPNSLGIRIYLQAIKSVRLAYIEKTTSIMDRIFHGWIAVFIFRFWCLWINEMNKKSLDTILTQLSDFEFKFNEKVKPKSQYFITYQSHFCVEINAHCLIYLATLVNEQQLPIEALNIWLQNSQGCESTFRSARSISSNFSSGVNFTVSQFLSQANKLSTLQNIKNNKNSNHLRFPQHHKLSKASENVFELSKPTVVSKINIENAVHKAYEYVVHLLSPLKIKHFERNGQIITLNDLSNIISRQLEVFWSAEIELNEDATDDSDSKISDTTINELNGYDSDDLLESDDGNDSIHVTNMKNGQGIRVFDKVKQELAHTYFQVNINNEIKYLHKQTACWLLEKDKNTLSADRLSRVRGL